MAKPLESFVTVFDYFIRPYLILKALQWKEYWIKAADLVYGQHISRMPFT